MSYPLRLPPELDAEARERCARLGISLNAFIAVALDAYLRGVGSAPASRRLVKPAVKKAAKPRAVAGSKADECPDWRVFHPDPDMWPYVDPEFAARFEGLGVDDDAAAIALEIEYWSTRQRPAH